MISANIRAVAVQGTLLLVFLSSCVSSQPGGNSPGEVIPMDRQVIVVLPDTKTISGKVGALLVKATPESLLQALGEIGTSGIQATEFGRAAAYAAATMLFVLYPDDFRGTPAVDPPSTHALTKYSNEMKIGGWIAPPSFGKVDAVDIILPAVAVFSAKDPLPSVKILESLSMAESAGVVSVVPGLVDAWFKEKSLDYQGAIEGYRAVIAKFGRCSFAEASLGRCLLASGNQSEAMTVYGTLVAAYPGNIPLKRELGMLYYRSRDWAKAEPLVSQVLQRSPEDIPLLLVRAHLLVELARWTEAVPLLDLCAKTDSGSRLYLELKIRVQWDGLKALEPALQSCDTAMAKYPDDIEFMLKKAEILLKSGSGGTTALDLSALALARDPYNARALRIELAVFVQRQDWTRAKDTLQALLKVDPSFSDNKLSYTVYSGSGDADRARLVASAWFKAEPDGEDSCIAWLRTNLGLKTQAQASLDIIKTRLSQKGSARFRSDLFFIRSRYSENADDELRDLRQSLMEFPQNADALVAMFDITFGKKEYKPAQAYLKQAMTLRPMDPELEKRKQVLDEAMANRL